MHKEIFQIFESHNRKIVELQNRVTELEEKISAITTVDLDTKVSAEMLSTTIQRNEIQQNKTISI